MSVPAPPYSPSALGKALVQAGGPRALTAGGATSSAVTFGTVMPDADYQVDVNVVSGVVSGGWVVRGRRTTDFVIYFPHGVSDGAFLWRAWRIT